MTTKKAADGEKKTNSTKDGKIARKCLYQQNNRKKKAGTTKSKDKSTISKSAYDNMKSGFKK